jgi:hypothetical protein
LEVVVVDLIHLGVELPLEEIVILLIPLLLLPEGAEQHLSDLVLLEELSLPVEAVEVTEVVADLVTLHLQAAAVALGDMLEVEVMEELLIKLEVLALVAAAVAAVLEGHLT